MGGNEFQTPVNVEDPQVLKHYLDSLSSSLSNIVKSLGTVSKKVSSVAGGLTVDPAFIKFVDDTQKVEAEIKALVEENLETITKQSTDLSYVIEQFGTNYEQNQAASWYGLTVGAGNIMTGFTIGSLDYDTTSYGNEDSVFGIQADRFYIGRAATTQSEVDYLEDKDQDFLTLYNTEGEALPAFGIDWNPTNSEYEIFFNGKVSFNNVNTGFVDGEGNTVIDGGQIRTVGLIAENISGTEIVGKTIIGGVIEGARINGAVIKASYLDLDGDLEVLTDFHISLTEYTANPSLYTDAVFIEIDNEYRLPTLSTVVFPPMVPTDLYQDQEIEGAVFAYNQGNKNTNLKARKFYPYFVCTGEWDVYSEMVTGNLLTYIGSPKCEVYLGSTMLFRVQHNYPNITITTATGSLDFSTPETLDKVLIGSFYAFNLEFNVYGGSTASSGGFVTNTVKSRITMKPFGASSGTPWSDTKSFRVKSFFSRLGFVGSTVFPGVSGARISSAFTINNMV